MFNSEKMERLNKIEKGLSVRFAQIEEVALFNQNKVLSAFNKLNITNNHFSGTTGYGYTDKGRFDLAKVFAEVFKTEDGIVTTHLTSGTHSIATVLYGLLRPNDVLFSISGEPYDTLHDTIYGKGNGSLEDLGITFKKVELTESSTFDEDMVLDVVKKLKPKVVYIQRSRGYSSRKAISVCEMGKIFPKIKKISPNSFIVVDNCYGEFVEKKEPTEVGADVCVGSLIKNIGGGLAPTGGYIVGTKKAISLIENRYTCPSLGRETGSSEAGYRLLYQGLFLAPHVVCQALKGAYLIGQVMALQGYRVIPETDENTYDIVKSIVFNTEEELISFVQLIQKLSPVDSNALPIPYDMAGYTTKVIMAAGTFVEGASIELSCDSPIRKPYIAYFQGGLTYEQLKIVAYNLLDFSKNA